MVNAMNVIKTTKNVMGITYLYVTQANGLPKTVLLDAKMENVTFAHQDHVKVIRHAKMANGENPVQTVAIMGAVMNVNPARVQIIKHVLQVTSKNAIRVAYMDNA